MPVAKGTFHVQKQPTGLGPGLWRYSLDKVWQGDFVGTSCGEMISGGDPAQGAAGYVAMERLEGVVQGRHGSFALAQLATMSKEGRMLRVLVVPGSGTEELAGISGTPEIVIEDRLHSYVLDYVLAGK